MRRSNKDTIDNFFEYGLDVENRILYLGSYSYDANGEQENGVDFMMADRAIKSLVILDRLAPDGDKPITIILNSPGGDVDHGMAIYDAIKSCKNYVTILVYGVAYSMGSIIVQAANERVLSPNSRFMIHYGSMSLGETHPKTFSNWAEECVKARTVMEDIYLEKIHQAQPNFTRRQLQKMLDFDTILSPEETVKLGLADSILVTNK